MDAVTYIGQIVNFLVFVGVLYFLLYKPVGKIMKDRQEKMEADLLAAKEERSAAETLRTQVEERANELERDRNTVLKEARTQAEEHKKALLSETESQGRDRLERFRRVMEQERRDVIAAVKDRLLDTIVRVAGSVSADACGELADRAIGRVAKLLENIDGADLEKAKSALTGPGTVLKARSAAPLSEAQVQRLQDIIKTRLGLDALELTFEEDPSLVAGLEVTIGHINLEAHWRGLIDEALAADLEGIGSPGQESAAAEG